MGLHVDTTAESVIFTARRYASTEYVCLPVCLLIYLTRMSADAKDCTTHHK